MKHEFKKEPICPHCNKEVGIDDNELYELYDSDDNHELECPHCKSVFWVRPSVRYTFSTNIENEF